MSTKTGQPNLRGEIAGHRFKQMVEREHEEAKRARLEKSTNKLLNKYNNKG